MALCMHYLKETEGRKECWGWNVTCTVFVTVTFLSQSVQNSAQMTCSVRFFNALCILFCACVGIKAWRERTRKLPMSIFFYFLNFFFFSFFFSFFRTPPKFILEMLLMPGLAFSNNNFVEKFCGIYLRASWRENAGLLTNTRVVKVRIKDLGTNLLVALALVMGRCRDGGGGGSPKKNQNPNTLKMVNGFSRA